MARLIYSAIASLDGYIEDAHGKFDWAEPDEEVHRFVNDLQRPVGTYLYGRGLYDTMVFWESPPGLAAESSVMRDFAAIWQAAEKVVYSTTLRAVSEVAGTLTTTPPYESQALAARPTGADLREPSPLNNRRPRASSRLGRAAKSLKR